MDFALRTPTAQSSMLDTREQLRQACCDNLYFLAKGVLGFKKMSPQFHLPLCQKLDTVQLPYARRMDLWPRGHYKTSTITISKSIQHYLRSDAVRVLIVTASGLNSSKWLGMIQAQFESNAVFRWLWEDRLPELKTTKWNQHEALCPRKHPRVESTFTVMGVGSRVTGQHFDVMVKDDIIDEKTEKTPDVMQKIIDWHEYSMNLFDGPERGVDHFVGTRYLIGDIYGHVMAVSPEYTTSVVAALRRDGSPTFPEEFSREGLLKMRARDPYKFATQQMNNPKDASIADFRLDWLRYFVWTTGGEIAVESGMPGEVEPAGLGNA